MNENLILQNIAEVEKTINSLNEGRK